MASSRGSSNTPDLTDVMTAMAVLQSMGNCYITVRLRLRGMEMDGPLLVEIQAWPQFHPTVGRVPLASVEFVCQAGVWKNLDTVVLRQLYALDTRLGLVGN